MYMNQIKVLLLQEPLYLPIAADAPGSIQTNHRLTDNARARDIVVRTGVFSNHMSKHPQKLRFLLKT